MKKIFQIEGIIANNAQIVAAGDYHARHVVTDAIRLAAVAAGAAAAVEAAVEAAGDKRYLSLALVAANVAAADVIHNIILAAGEYSTTDIANIILRATDDVNGAVGVYAAYDDYIAAARDYAAATVAEAAEAAATAEWALKSTEY